MQQTVRCEASTNDGPTACEDSLKRTRKRGAPWTYPPDAYIQRITCPTRLQFYKNLLEQELASTGRKILNASRCSSKLNHDLRKKTTADAHGDAPSRRGGEEEGDRPARRAVRKTSTLRRPRHRKELSKFRVRDRSTSVEHLQVQANVNGSEVHCKVAKKNSALYNVSECQKEHLKYGLFNKGRASMSSRPPEQALARPIPNLAPRREGKDRRAFHPQAQQRNMLRPRRPGEVSALKKQVLRLSSSQIMHLDIKPKIGTPRWEPHCSLPLQKNQRRTNVTAPHFVLFRRSSPSGQPHLNRVFRGSQIRRCTHTPLVQRLTPVGRNLISRGTSNVSSRNGILQLYRMMSPLQKRCLSCPRNAKQYTPDNAPRNQSGSKNTHQPRVEKRPVPPQSVKTIRPRSNSLQHTPYYARSNISPPLTRNHSVSRPPQRLLSTRSICGNCKIGNRYMRTKPTLLSSRPVRNKSHVLPGVTLLRSRPPSSRGASRDRSSVISREATSLCNRPSMLSSGATLFRQRSSMYSTRPASLRKKPSIFASGVPSTSYGVSLQCNGSREPTPRPIAQRPRIIPPRPPLPGLNSLRVRPPVPSRAQTSINTRPPPTPSKQASMRDLLNSLKKSSQRNLRQTLTRENPKIVNSMFNRDVLPCISLRPLRKSATFSGCSYDVLAEKDEEEIQNFETTVSSNSTYTQTFICQERTVNNIKNTRA